MCCSNAREVAPGAAHGPPCLPLVWLAWPVLKRARSCSSWACRSRTTISLPSCERQRTRHVTGLRVRVEITGSQRYEKRRGISGSSYHERSHYLHPHPYATSQSHRAAVGAVFGAVCSTLQWTMW
jgi:hypothetical protein